MLTRIRSLSPRIVDWTLAVGLTGYAQAGVWVRPGVVPGPKAVGALGLAAMTVPLGLRRRWPLAVACVSMGALTAESLGAGVGDIVLVDGFFFGVIGGTVWLVGRYVRRRR